MIHEEGGDEWVAVAANDDGKLDSAEWRIVASNLQPEDVGLIAAAPDLLEACKKALKAFEYNWAINWDELRNAIKKAEGG